MYVYIYCTCILGLCLEYEKNESKYSYLDTWWNKMCLFQFYLHYSFYSFFMRRSIITVIFTLSPFLSRSAMIYNYSMNIFRLDSVIIAFQTYCKEYFPRLDSCCRPTEASGESCQLWSQVNHGGQNRLRFNPS